MLNIAEPIWRWLARISFGAAILFICFLAFSSDPPDLTMQMSDKLNHALAFFVLAVMLDQTAARLHLWCAVILPLLIYGVFIEIVQGQLGYREMSWLDVGADACGILLYACGRRVIRDGIARMVSRDRYQ